MVDYRGYIGWIIGIIILIFIFWLLNKFYRHRAEYGTGLERDVERRVGLRPAGKKLKQILEATVAEKKRTAAAKAKEAAQATLSKKEGAPEEEVEAEKAAAVGAKAAEEMEASAEALDAIEGRALGLISGLKLIEQAIENYVNRERQEDAKEEEEIKHINGLVGKISRMVNYDKIDNNVLSYLESFLNNLLNYLRAEIATEEGKEKDMIELMQQLLVAGAEMKQVLNEAKTEAGVFRKFERKSRNDFTKEIKELKRTIKAKEKELKQAKRAGKGADKGLIANLKREIALMIKQYSAAQRLHSQLKTTYKMMDKEIKQTRKLIRRLLRLDRKVNRFDKRLNKAESKIKKKFEELRKSFEKLGKSVDVFEQSKNIHLIALSISRDMNEYLKENKDLGLMTANFDRTLRDIITIALEMVKLTEAYERMIQGLTDSEKAVDQGMEVLTKIMQSVVTASEIQVDEKEVAETLSQLRGLLDYEEKIEKYLSKILTALEYKMRQLFTLVEQLAQEDQRIVNTIEASSSNLGRMMSGAVDRKVAIDETYMSQAEQFEDQLRRRNAAASRAYSQARSAEFRT